MNSSDTTMHSFCLPCLENPNPKSPDSPTDFSEEAFFLGEQTASAFLTWCG